MKLDLITPAVSQRCNATLQKFQHDISNAFVSNPKFRFSFGSKRCVKSVAVKGSSYRPKATQHQRIHTDGPTKCRTHIWNDDGTLRLNGDLNDFEELRLTLMQSLSALLAFLPDTALGMPSSASIAATLKLAIPMGRAVLFRFDWLHHGWKCVDERDLDALRVHFRAHFYLLSGVLRELPTVDLEATFEFLSALSHEDLDDATKLLLLECLETFVPVSTVRKGFSMFAVEQGYKLFATQDSLSQHLVKTSGCS
jgi:hypothetical protein